VVATVDAAGGVSNASSESGNKLLAEAAIDAVKHWKFAPGEGSSTVVVQINFDM
jgi:TonB family protein